MSDEQPSGATSPSIATVIPFYGAQNRPLFAIERRCMDRDGKVIARLDELLPVGTVLDIGAGDGFTAARLTRPDRTVVALEPAAGMIAPERRLPWVRGVAQALPFPQGAFAAAYATWAYFFPGIGHGDPGLTELHRVVRPGGLLAFADNAGGDEFSALAADPASLASDPDWWAARGFDREVVETSFRFDTLDEMRTLFARYFAQRGREETRLEIGYRVAIYTARSRGSVGAAPGPCDLPGDRADGGADTGLIRADAWRVSAGGAAMGSRAAGRPLSPGWSSDGRPAVPTARMAPAPAPPPATDPVGTDGGKPRPYQMPPQ